MDEKEARNWAMFCHLSALAGYFFMFLIGNIVLPIIFWQVKKDNHPFIDYHGKEAVNFQISFVIYFLICIPFMLVLVGFFMAGLLYIVSVVLTIIAGLKASNGEMYRYPFTIRFLK